MDRNPVPLALALHSSMVDSYWNSGNDVEGLRVGFIQYCADVYWVNCLGAFFLYSGTFSWSQVFSKSSAGSVGFIYNDQSRIILFFFYT